MEDNENCVKKNVILFEKRGIYDCFGKKIMVSSTLDGWWNLKYLRPQGIIELVFYVLPLIHPHNYNLSTIIYAM